MAGAHSFQELVTAGDRFLITVERIPGRTAHDEALDKIVAFAARGRETGLFDALSLTDNPGGIPALSPDNLAAEIEAAGMPVIVHFPAKDMNRAMIESRALALERRGIRTLLVMSGDYPVEGQAGLSMPVFDLDPSHMLAMLDLMNRGMRFTGDSGAVEEGPRTSC